jgi:hypothetical protein
MVHLVLRVYVVITSENLLGDSVFTGNQLHMTTSSYMYKGAQDKMYNKAVTILLQLD